MNLMDPSQNPHRPEQISSESYNTLSSVQIQAPSYTYEPDQSTYAYYPPSYQYTYYDASQQAAYDYSNAYYQQPHHEPPTSTLPPAAPQPQSDPAAAAAAYQYSYYPPPQPQGAEYGGVYGSGAAIHTGTSTAQILQPSHRGTGRRGGRIFRGAGRGRRGQVPQPPAPVWPPRMAWCELCRVECNTPEILEQHKNGKKHKKNVKVQEELQRVMAAGHNVQSSSQVQPEVAYQPKATEGSELPPEGTLSVETVNGRSEQQPQENLPSQALGEENKAEPEHPKPESTRDSGESQGRGPKRKISGGPGGRGGKKLRSHDGRRKPAEPPKPKQIPLICELCNVTCESQVVFQSHLQGKKHLSNRKRFEESQAVLGQVATQALYPALQPAYPALPQPNAALATPLDPKLQQQNIPGGQGFLTQPAPSLLPQGQEVSALTPAVASALPPPIPMLQSLDHQDPGPQFQSQ
ncbi:uncharacterized protein LOC115996532 [Ipomoea triloba]|uniref:uncharacterized protein LOC115996532 n=1 Tax=Ipomoea triloba TaxID=35885 RepID=UPI00125D967F|nr:uncharacterized protein LOC115996532 [Ipomoea triloba]